MDLRTDLALEVRESFEKDNVEIDGVILEKESKYNNKVEVTRVIIKNNAGAEAMGKPKGTYVTVEFGENFLFDRESQLSISCEICEQLFLMLGKSFNGEILVIGLGNRQVTPDSLGPKVTDKLLINRHLIKEFGNSIKHHMKISAISPGVMGQTGIETFEIIKAVVKEVKPDKLLVIDALAARNTGRLNTTIQLTDTGICPGAGVGNNRAAINRETLGIEVIALGVPTVVDAWTIVSDRLEQVLNEQSYNKQERNIFMSQFHGKDLREMFVTPKNIDESISNMSMIIADAINKMVFEE